MLIIGIPYHPLHLCQHLAYKIMDWKSYLKPDERRELERTEIKRNEAAKSFAALRLKLKSRCESRMRQAKVKSKPAS